MRALSLLFLSLSLLSLRLLLLFLSLSPYSSVFIFGGKWCRRRVCWSLHAAVLSSRRIRLEQAPSQSMEGTKQWNEKGVTQSLINNYIGEEKWGEKMEEERTFHRLSFVVLFLFPMFSLIYLSFPSPSLSLSLTLTLFLFLSCILSLPLSLTLTLFSSKIFSGNGPGAGSLDAGGQKCETRRSGIRAPGWDGARL